MKTLKQGRMYVTCPKCGQSIRSEERLRNHQGRCLATGRWAKGSRK